MLQAAPSKWQWSEGRPTPGHRVSGGNKGQHGGRREGGADHPRHGGQGWRNPSQHGGGGEGGEGGERGGEGGASAGSCK